MVLFNPILYHVQRLISHSLLDNSNDNYNDNTNSKPGQIMEASSGINLQETQDNYAPVAVVAIPEIASMIAMNLSKTDIASSIIVCKSWSISFTPHLWRNISSRIPNPHNAQILPNLLRTFGGLIRTLFFTDVPEHYLLRAEPSTGLVFDCDTIENLVKMIIHIEADKKPAIQRMLQRNRYTLRELRLTFRIDKGRMPIRGCASTGAALVFVPSSSLAGIPSLPAASTTTNTNTNTNTTMSSSTTASATALTAMAIRASSMGKTTWMGEPLFEFPSLSIGGMPSLQSLYLENWSMTKQELVQILMACPALHLLSLAGIHIIHVDNSSTSPSASSPTLLSSSPSSSSSTAAPTELNSKQSAIVPSFQHHSIRTFRMCAQLYPILDLLPNLRTLEFYRFDRPVPHEVLSDFCQSIQQHCPRLSQLWPLGFECSMLPPILDVLPSLTVFRGSSDIATVLSILCHASTLEEANLSDYAERTFMPLKFLETCPRLRQLRTGHSNTTMEDVKESISGPGRGWVCKGLRVLRLSIFKMSPVLIEKVMRDLNAVRETDFKGRWLMSQARMAVLSAKAAIQNGTADIILNDTESESRAGSGSLEKAANEGAKIMSESVSSSSSPSTITASITATNTTSATAVEGTGLVESTTMGTPATAEYIFLQKRMAMKLKQEQQLQEAFKELSEEQLEFQRLLSNYLGDLPCLIWVNLGTGWYCIPRNGLLSGQAPIPEA
ncbi:hypothetical protein BX616_010313 [Lobosporangium transversale]|uniref:F-box domain-containing protein n=1 Tax=Lobosporangium transversale TaxID=64571 RepID=A0A1Y2GXZ6_9FUNG|nr:hypothetical protein BCR41DRAFT_347758 [Lobosporangium transversale]KAF9912533.1 hypothetical protein BX616_010313 [Lobosporangium transversale]ORZ26684.1 hypothetical protein BCR41DRAFT_347758 [Lobosporangium transversale]|eukprot:XP_021884447.1 hypothetical protein BCR41DRAFT_347758 [Lobosporangium transversale]